MNQIANIFGISVLANNAYQSEKNQISKSLEKIAELRKDYYYYQQELKEREDKSEEYLKTLPDLMNGMFDHLSQVVDEEEA